MMIWLWLLQADFPDVVRTDEKGRPVYTLARMSFNMFSPGGVFFHLAFLLSR
jgi:hypothetical protein